MADQLGGNLRRGTQAFVPGSGAARVLGASPIGPHQRLQGALRQSIEGLAAGDTSLQVTLDRSPLVERDLAGVEGLQLSQGGVKLLRLIHWNFLRTGGPHPVVCPAPLYC